MTPSQLLRDVLPAVLPALFTTKGGLSEHLFYLSFLLRADGMGDGEGAVSQTQIGESDSRMTLLRACLCATCVTSLRRAS